MVRRSADSGHLEVIVRFWRNLVFDVLHPDLIGYGCRVCTLPSSQCRRYCRDPMPPKGVGFPDPLSGTLNYLIDMENAVIVDVEATPARTYDEVAAARTMIERTEQRIGLKPQRLAADTAYGTGKFLGWLVGTGIAPQIPVWDKSTREDGTFSRSDFTFDRERNVYVCPAGK